MIAKTTQHVSIELDDDARVVVVADSHSKPHPDALRWIEREQPAAIFHAGDIGNLEVLDKLAAIAPVHPVRGNIDGRDPRTPDILVADLTAAGRALRVLMTHIAVYGPRLRKDVAESAVKNQASLVLCGHSHVPLINSDRGLFVFNPGSLGPRRFQLPITFGVIDLSDGKLSLRHVDCESGEAWAPPA